MYKLLKKFNTLTYSLCDLVGIIISIGHDKDKGNVLGQLAEIQARWKSEKDMGRSLFKHTPETLPVSPLRARHRSSKDERHSSLSSEVGGLAGEGDAKGIVHSRVIQDALGAEAVETSAYRIAPSLTEKDHFSLGTEG